MRPGVCLVASMFRDSTEYLSAYFAQQDQFAAQMAEHGVHVRWVLVEGDSTDGTRKMLQQWAEGRDVTIEVREDGGPYFSSSNNPERWKKLAWVANATLDAIRESDTYYAWVESDLRFDPSVLVRLHEYLSDERPIVAPLLMQMGADRFYDVHGTKVGGIGFAPWPPYHDCLADDPEFVSADSSGGVSVMWAQVAAQARNTPEEGYVGFAKTLVGKGYPWTLAAREKVWHQ